jgi:hypothetical protein
MDRQIDLVERRVLLIQDRIIKQRDNASQVLKRLDRQLKAQEEIKKEWIKKINMERERMRVDRNEAFKNHRLIIDDLRVKYEQERDNKLRDVKAMIREEEEVIRELQRKRDEGIMKTKAEENEIKSRWQVKINDLLREEQSAMRTGVVRQKRLLEAPNIFSMTLDKPNQVRMKRTRTQTSFRR